MAQRDGEIPPPRWAAAMPRASLRVQTTSEGITTMIDEETEMMRKPDYLIGRIAAIEQIVRVLIATLPEPQRNFLYDAAREFADHTRLLATTDPARDRADAAWDVKENLISADDWQEHFAETVKP